MPSEAGAQPPVAEPIQGVDSAAGLTVAQMLASQPLPVPGREPVTAYLLAHAARVAAPPLLLELLEERERQGLAAYGVTLETHNGRDVRCDALQEAVDLLKYLTQWMLERRDGGRPIAAQTRAMAEVYTLVIDLATELAEGRES